MYRILPFIFWGMLFCIGFLVGGMHSAVVYLLCGLVISLLTFLFGGVGLFLSAIFILGFVLVGWQLSLILMGVVLAALLFLALLG